MIMGGYLVFWLNVVLGDICADVSEANKRRIALQTGGKTSEPPSSSFVPHMRDQQM